MELQIFKKENLLGREINIYGTNENPLFLAKDVAEWIEHSNLSKMVKDSELQEDEYLLELVVSSGQRREMLFITENGLYEVLMQSRKPIAKDFKKGIKHILKEVRVNGGFVSTFENDTPELIMARALKVADQTLQTFKMRNKQLEMQNQIKDERLLFVEPLAKLAQECYVSTETMTASTISARLGFKSANAFNKYLKDNKIQYKIKGDDCWKLTSKYSCNGYTKTIPYPFLKRDGSKGTSNQMEWTESGFVFLRQFINKKTTAQ